DDGQGDDEPGRAEATRVDRAPSPHGGAAERTPPGPDVGAAQGLLYESVGDGCDGDGGAELQGHDAEAGLMGPGEQQNGPMPEVDAVGARTDPGQRLSAEEPRRIRVRRGGRGYDDYGAEGDAGEAAFIEEAAVLIQAQERPQEQDGREQGAE